MDIYVVASGDTIDSIAANFGVSADSIIYGNQLVYPYALAVGQALLITYPEEFSPAKPSIQAGGYAYTYISPWVLEQTLPFLTELFIFSYGFTPEGNLLLPPLDDYWMIQAALSQDVRPILTLTPFDASGQFNNALITSVVQNENYRQNLIGQVLNTLQSKNFAGADVDFEFIQRQDRDAFTAFVNELAAALRPYGYTTTVALAPKTSANQPGLLYEGKDYAALGAAADSVLLMTYEWGYKYGPNMAVAPLNAVRRVVDYAVTEIPPEKIHLGIPNYGYDWPLPFEQGTTAAVTIGNVEAIRIAVENNAVIQFDETAMSPYFRYTLNGTEHEVWFEDVRSISAKFNLIKEYGLSGADYWQIMRWWRANWLLLNDRF
ncbi:MAG: glycosyl hydrolase family 18 protein [Eubacteriales bacterium]|nr:glycosyl hydrolase family 18 protein [Eubacteriales bacterium]